MKSTTTGALMCLALTLGLSATCAASIPDGMGVLPAKVPIPSDNPMSKGKIELGKALYFEPALSKSGHLSCNSCHNLATYGVDNQARSIGHKWQRGGRNAPTVLNSGFWSTQFWDGRAATLEEQSKGPPTNPVEMAMGSAADVTAQLKRAGYEPLFVTVFGKGGLTMDNVAKAIAAFERTLLTPNSAFDRFVQGKGEISAAAKRGMKRMDDIGCTNCHEGALFTSNGFETFSYGTDPGVMSVTHKKADDHSFRVQSLRNVAMTAPYFHDGSVATLTEAVKTMARVMLDTKLSDTEAAEIVAFLKTLTGELAPVILPVLPRPAGRALPWTD